MSELELLLSLDRERAQPLRLQLEADLRAAIRSGRLTGGSALPPSRSLARRLGVSRGVVVDAYEQLVAEGYLTARTGAGTRVSNAVTPGEPVRRRQPSSPAIRFDFHPGHPDLSRFPRAAWMRALHRALDATPYRALGYGDARGAITLREALASYLGRLRGAIADVERTVVTSGQLQGIALVLRALRRRGVRRIALEDPGFFWHRACVAHLGLEGVPVPIDGEGLDVQSLRTTDADAVVVTPAHQSPTGAVLSASRRAELLDWAERRGAYVIEDDYDSAYRYDRSPVGALQGLASERVVYSGSVSKTLAPGLRIGWLLVPHELADAVVGEKTLDDLGSPVLEQLALAELLERGELDRHLRRMRPRYRARREALVDALGRHMPETRLAGISAGLHTLALLAPGTDETALVTAALERGILVHGLSTARFDPRSGPPGLIVGYGNVATASIDRGIGELAGLCPRRGIDR
jgi:GntR family transcriptional regulator / MocR family aminotransferase